MGVEALELQRVVWQWLSKLPLPRLLQAAFIKGWERRVTHFPEALFKARVSPQARMPRAHPFAGVCGTGG